MSDWLFIDRIDLLEDNFLVIELSDGRTIELTLTQILALQPRVVSIQRPSHKKACNAKPLLE